MEGKSFLAANGSGSIKWEGNFTFYLVNVKPSANENVYYDFISQLQVPTTYFIDNNIHQTTVSCTAVDSKTWEIIFPGKHYFFMGTRITPFQIPFVSLECASIMSLVFSFVYTILFYSHMHYVAMPMPL